MIKQVLKLSLLFSLYAHIAICQEAHWQKISHIPARGLDLLSVDGRSQVFTADQQGNIRQYTTQGDSSNIYSPVFRARLDKLEAFWTTTIFLFSADLQQYELLDRFLNPIASYLFRDSDVGVVRYATLGNGNVIWMLNETRLSLVKWDFRRNQVLQEQPLSLVLPNRDLKVINLTERKNLLFLQLEKAGVYIFDNQANFIQQLASIPDVPVFIYEDHFYYISENRLKKTNYSSEKTTSYPLHDTIYQKVAITKQHLLLYADTGIDIFVRPAEL
ncbi:hypothetical protein [Lunatibacter salilacus]|uniref:hypothetical protein n=1 Tax=Lunatibacter salilacus TaxID=2483804 RepID=UPI00131D3526|nr:hypothetical protein [Lunatibacter salilacus]